MSENGFSEFVSQRVAKNIVDNPSTLKDSFPKPYDAFIRDARDGNDDYGERHAVVSGYLENEDEKRYTSIIVSMPGFAERALARAIHREPRAVLHITC